MLIAKFKTILGMFFLIQLIISKLPLYFTRLNIINYPILSRRDFSQKIIHEIIKIKLDLT